MMEELLDQQDLILSFPPNSKPRQFGQPWEQINQRMKKALQQPSKVANYQQSSQRYTVKKQHSEPTTSQEKYTQSKKVIFGHIQEEPSKDNTRARLKIMRSITQADNIDSYRRSLSNKRTEVVPQIKPARIKLKELKLNSYHFKNKDIKTKPSKQQQSNGRNDQLYQRESESHRENNREQIYNDLPLKIIEEEKPSTNRIQKSHSELLLSPKGMMMVPAKIDIRIRREFSNAISTGRTSPLFLKKSFHLHNHSHSKENSPLFPFLNQHEHQRQSNFIHGVHSYHHWLQVRRSFSKQGSNQDCKRSREKELKARVKRELSELNRKKLFVNTRPSRLKLFK